MGTCHYFDRIYDRPHHLVQGEDFILSINLEDESGDSLDLLGLSATAIIRDVMGNEVTAGVATIDVTAGKVSVVISRAQTMRMTGEYVLLVSVSGPTGYVLYALRSPCVVFSAGIAIPTQISGSILGATN